MHGKEKVFLMIKGNLDGREFEVHAFDRYFNTVMKVDRYTRGGAICLELVMKEDAEPFCTLTCNIPGTILRDWEILVKTWSENRETAEEMLKSGFFKDTGRRVSTGFVQAQIWEVL